MKLKATLKSTQTKTYFLAAQALLCDLRSNASFSALFLALQALSTDLQLFQQFLWLKRYAVLVNAFYLELKDACYVLQQIHGHKNKLI